LCICNYLHISSKRGIDGGGNFGGEERKKEKNLPQLWEITKKKIFLRNIGESYSDLQSALIFSSSRISIRQKLLVNINQYIKLTLQVPSTIVPVPPINVKWKLVMIYLVKGFLTP